MMGKVRTERIVESVTPTVANSLSALYFSANNGVVGPEGIPAKSTATANNKEGMGNNITGNRTNGMMISFRQAANHIYLFFNKRPKLFRSSLDIKLPIIIMERGMVMVPTYSKER